VTTRVAPLSEDFIEFFHERAGIMQFDGGLRRSDAELHAFHLATKYFSSQMNSNQFVRRHPQVITAVEWNKPGDHPAVTETTVETDGVSETRYILHTAIGKKIVRPGSMITQQGSRRFLCFTPQQFAKRFRPATAAEIADDAAGQPLGPREQGQFPVDSTEA
jgi:hypothetical protein